MRLRFLAAFIGILVSNLIVVLAQQQVKGTIEGIVVNASTGEAVTGAQVAISVGTGPARTSVADLLSAMLAGGGPVNFPPRGGGRGIPPVTTRSDGRFTFELDPGAYRVSVNANGFVPAELGQRSIYGAGTPLYLESGETRNALTLRLTPTGIVTGRIVDQAGMPAEQVPVQVLRVAYNAFGQKLMESGAAAITDDRGEFRVYGITPGQYYLSSGSMVAASVGVAAVGGTDLSNGGTIPRPQALRQVYTLSYYPGETDLSRAQLLEIKSGAEFTANMRVTRETRYRVSGTVIDSRTGKPPAEAFVGLTYYTGNGGTSGSGTGLDPATGAFNFQNVIPAPYVIEAQIQERSLGAGAGVQDTAAQIAAEFANPTAHVPVTVTGNIENLVITISPPGVLEGRLTVNGEPLSSLPNFDRIRPVLRQFSYGGTLPVGPSSPLAADGSFRLKMREGDYKFAVTGLPAGFYIEKAEIRDADLLRDPIHLSSSSSGNLSVVLRRGTGTITGTVTDAQSRAVSGVQVVLVPDERRRLDLYSTAIADKAGRFTIAEVAPGNYRVFSWEAIQPFSYFDADVLSRYEARGQRVQVGESSGSTVEVRIIPVEQ